MASDAVTGYTPRAMADGRSGKRASAILSSSVAGGGPSKTLESTLAMRGHARPIRSAFLALSSCVTWTRRRAILLSVWYFEIVGAV